MFYIQVLDAIASLDLEYESVIVITIKANYDNKKIIELYTLTLNFKLNKHSMHLQYLCKIMHGRLHRRFKKAVLG